MTALDDTHMTEREAAALSLARGSGVSLWLQIAETLEAEIRDGLIDRGSRLPTEAELAARFGVNRHTLRRAIAHLGQRHLVRATPGRGTFVAEGAIAYRLGSRTRFSEIVSAAGRQPTGRLLDFHRVGAPSDVARRLGIPAGSPILRLETLREANGTPISFATQSLPLPRFDGFEGAFGDLGSVTSALARFGVKDYRRIESRLTARISDALEMRLLDIARGHPVIVVDAVEVDQEGTPIIAQQTRFAADRIEIVIAPNG